MKKLIPLKFSVFLFFFCWGIGITNAQFKVLHNFNDTTGELPNGSLITSANKFYGLTPYGGANNNGCIFSIDTNGDGYKDLFDFNATDGGAAEGSLILSGNKLFGMTSGGGVYGSGVVFSIDTNGNGYKVLLNFNSTNGQNPDGNLTIIGNRLFGMTGSGCSHGYGNIFAIDTNGSGYRDLLDFNGTNGAYPYGSFTFSGNRLFGMTNAGGANFDGCIFSIDTNGDGYKDILDFNGTNGESPIGSLILSGKVFYGMTYFGGALNKGCVFSIDTNGNGYKDLLDFNGNNGEWPSGDLTLSGNKLYGMTLKGGVDLGNIFSIDTNGIGYKNMIDFNITNGEYPEGSLIFSGNKLFGMTPNGGAYGDGVIFSYNPFINSLVIDSIANVINVNCFDSTKGSVSVIAYNGIPPYTYYWSPGGETTETVSGLKAGSYTVRVSDKYNNITIDSVTIIQPSAPLQINVSSTLSSCKTNDGSASIIALGDTPPYTYNWSPSGGNDSVAQGLSYGHYSCIVTDSKGCNKSINVTVKDSGTLQATALPSYFSKCVFEDSSGIASANISGGTKPYSCLWSPYGGTDTIAQNLSKGTYTITVTDSNGCKTDTIVSINPPTKLTAVSVTQCRAYATSPGHYVTLGSAKVTVNGGTPPYSYSWNPPCSTTDTVVPSLCTNGCGPYCCIITDANGCIDSSCGYFSGPTSIDPVIDNIDRVKVWPNPSNGVFTIQLSDSYGESLIEIYNMLGEKIYFETHRQAQGDNTVDLSNQPSGIYLYRITSEKGELVGSGKLIIQ